MYQVYNFVINNSFLAMTALHDGLLKDCLGFTVSYTLSLNCSYSIVGAYPVSNKVVSLLTSDLTIPLSYKKCRKSTFVDDLVWVYISGSGRRYEAVNVEPC